MRRERSAAPDGPLSPEARLLLLAARGTQPGDRGRLLASDVDWPRLAALAEQEGAAAIVWDWVSRKAMCTLPRDLATRWHKLAMISTFQALHLERLLHEVLDLCGRAGIEVMLLKGSALAYTAYGSFAERPMSDLDLLVRRADAGKAWTMLRAAGWTWPAARWSAGAYAAHQHLPPLLQQPAGAGAMRVEIHTALFPDGHPFQWPIEAVWANAARLRVNGRTVVVPHALDQLMHVCVHFAWSHALQWGGWRALRDIAAISRGGAMAWEPFVAAARRARATTCCYWPLRLARRFTGAAVPDDVLRALRPPRPEFVLSRLERHYALQLFATGHRCPSEALKDALWELGIAPRWSGHRALRPVELPGPRPGPAPSLWSRARNAAAAIGYLARLTTARRPRLA